MKTEFIGNPTSSLNIPVTATMTTNAGYEGSFSYTQADFEAVMKARGITIDGIPYEQWGTPNSTSGQALMPWWSTLPPHQCCCLNCPCHHRNTFVSGSSSPDTTSNLPIKITQVSTASSNPKPKLTNPAFAGKRKRRVN